MAFLSARTSRGIKYWSIVESRRINGKPKNFILEYLGTADTLLKKLQNNQQVSVKSYSHGDTQALLQTAIELDVVNIINKHIPKKNQYIRNDLTIGGSILLAAIGRACHPTSKDGWYQWCKETSLEYVLKTSFANLDSQHFWDQMNLIPVESLTKIEEEIVSKLIELYNIKLDTLLFDTTNFFTFIDSTNDKCDLPKRGKNKQKRTDLRQLGMALLVTKEDQLPLFHTTYEGNKADTKLFSEIFNDISQRIKQVIGDINDITIVFDKGNNSKKNFMQIDDEKIHYVGGLVSSHFKDLIKEANKNFYEITIGDEILPVYKVKKDIWGKDRTCVVTVSTQLKEGQLRGIEELLEKKYKKLEQLKQSLEKEKARKKFSQSDLEKLLKSTIKGQFVDSILKFEIFKIKNDFYSFTYSIDADKFEYLKDNILGRKIVVTNRHEWSEADILLAYRGQAKVEYAFRNLKNPFHLAVRPQFHWTDQKIKVHFFTCIIAYLISVATYMKACNQGGYKKNLSNLLEDLRTIRLSCQTVKKGTSVKYQLEKIPIELKETLKALCVNDDQIRLNLKLSGYIF